jgi:hypothetical protein
LGGVGVGIFPSLFWPAYLGAYGIMKLNEPDIVTQLQKELAEAEVEKKE